MSSEPSTSESWVHTHEQLPGGNIIEKYFSSILIEITENNKEEEEEEMK